MQTFIGTKTVLAVAMTRLAYNQLRGWELPADENGDDEGFLVEYVDGGKANHPDYKGYISWSPKDVFNNAYKPASTAKQRVELEFMELGVKLTALKAFIDSPKFEQLGEQRGLLIDQRRFMEQYHNVLNARLNNWKEI